MREILPVDRLSSRTMRIAAVVLMAVTSLCGSALAAQDRLMVAFDSKGEPTGPPWHVSDYGIKSKVYTPETLDEGFAGDLKRARLLVLSRKSGDKNLIVFEEPRYQKAVSAFLKNGGTIVFQYHAGPRWWLSDKAKQYFDQIGLGVYRKPADGGWYVGGEGYYEIASADTDHPMLSEPNSLEEVMKRFEGDQSANRYYANPSQSQRVLFHESGQPNHPALLIQEDVLGKGTVVMSRIFRLTEQHDPQPLVENILNHAFGSLQQGMTAGDSADGNQPSTDSATGPATDPAPPAQLDEKKMNALYLRGLVEKPWWDKAFSARLPLVVYEPAGLRRQAAPVRFVHEFASDTEPDSIRVVTPWGTVLPSEVHAAEKGSNRYEVLFTTDMLPHGYLPLFVYFSEDAPESQKTPKPPVQVERTEERLTLRNSRIQATLRKDRPALVGLQPLGAATGNQFYTGAGFVPEGYGVYWGKKGKLGVETWRLSIEQSPVRTVVRYRPADGAQGPRVTYALRRETNRIDYGIQAKQDGSLTRQVGYLPGRGMSPAAADHLYLAKDKNLRRLEISSTGPVADDLEMSEGWYAFEDTQTSNIVGEVFDLDSRGRTDVFIHGKKGYHVSNWMQLLPDSPVRGSFIARDSGGASAMREEYLRFKRPVRVQVAAVEQRSQAPSEPTVPVFGKDLIQTWHMEYWSDNGGGRLMRYHEVYPEAPEKTIPALVRNHKRLGANYVSMWAYQPFWKSKFAKGPRTNYLQSLVEQAHQAGLGVNTGTLELREPRYYGKALPEGFNGDAVKFHDLFVQAAREVGNTNVDMYMLRDEDTYTIQSEQARQLFRSRYGMDPVDQVDPDKLAEPAQHKTALFNMNVYTELLRDMAKAVREKNPEIILLDQVNISSMVLAQEGAPHDFERHADFLDTISMDLYGKPRPVFKFYEKYMRGMFNNEKPIVVYSGFTNDQQILRRNHNYLLMWGADALFSFPPGALYSSYKEGLRRNFYFLDYTGVGDMLARYHPARDIALLNDRAGLIDSIQKGEWGSQASQYLRRIQNVTTLKDLQTDILFSKDCTVSNLERYRMVYLTDDPAIGEEHVKALREYIARGGRVLIEGRAIGQTAVQELVGAVPAGDAGKQQVKVRMKDPLSFNGRVVPVRAKGATVRRRFDSGDPALLERKIGQGSVLYTPMVLSGQVLYQSRVGQWVKNLLRGGEGGVPLAVKTQSGSIDTNLFTDGENYILGLYNENPAAREATLHWTGESKPDVLVDFSSGDHRDFQPAMRVRVKGRSVRFFYIGDPQPMTMPAYRIPEPVGGIEHSASPEKGIAPLARPRQTPSKSEGKKLRKQNVEDILVAVASDRGEEADSPKAIVWGDEAIHQTLDQARGIQAVLTSNLRAEALSRFDLVIVPRVGHAKRPPALERGWEAQVRQYVRDGGSALLCHHAIGSGPTQSPLFPSVGRPRGYVEQRAFRITSEHPVASATSLKSHFPKLAEAPEFSNLLDQTVMDKGTTFTSGFPDYIPIRPGPNGQIVARGIGKAGAAALVAGAVGEGRVVLCGTAIGARIGSDYTPEEHMTRAEQNILLNSVHWLASSK